MTTPPLSLSQRLHNNKPLAIIASILVIIMAAIIVTWLNLPWRPDVTPFHTDGGFYAYFGKAILHGEIPYRDIWDDKPPLGYYLNALGLSIFGQTSWGVWWAGIVWILGCTVLFYLVLKKLFGNITAAMACVVFLTGLMSPQLFEGANLMEVYGLAPQIAIIGVTFLFFTHQKKYWFALLVGVLTAVAFLIKQPTIVLGGMSILIMIVSMLSEKKIREVFKLGLGFLLGFLSILLLVAMYWLWAGSLGQFIDGALLQGFSFMGGQESNIRGYFFYALVNILPNLLIGKLYLVALIAGGVFLIEKLYQVWLKPIFGAHLSVIECCLLVVLVLAPLIAKGLWPNQYIGKFALGSILLLGLYFLVKFFLLRSKPTGEPVFSAMEWTWLVAVLALPVEVLMASLGGRYFGHYFIAMIPSVSVVSAYPIWRVVSGLRETWKEKRKLFTNIVYLVLALSTLAWGIFSIVADWPSAEYVNNLAGIFSNQVRLNDLEKYIVQTTQPADTVLVWHIHLGINFNTDRKVPSRFLFPLNLFIPPNDQNTKLKEYVDELESNPPKLIVVQRVSSLALPFVNQPVDSLCKSYCTLEFEQAIKIPEIYQQWLRLQRFFDENYTLDNKVYDWIVYRKVP